MDDEASNHLFEISILTPEKTIFEDQVFSAIVPGVDGYLEILAHHAPIIVLVKPGKLTIKNKHEKELIFASSAGFLEVSNNQAKLLLDAVESPSDIDIERAKIAFERAQARLHSAKDEVDKERAKKALERAKNRIKIYQEIQT